MGSAGGLLRAWETPPTCQGTFLFLIFLRGIWSLRFIHHGLSKYRQTWWLSILYVHCDTCVPQRYPYPYNIWPFSWFEIFGLSRSLAMMPVILRVSSTLWCLVFLGRGFCLVDSASSFDTWSGIESTQVPLFRNCFLSFPRRSWVLAFFLPSTGLGLSLIAIAPSNSIKILFDPFKNSSIFLHHPKDCDGNETQMFFLTTNTLTCPYFPLYVAHHYPTNSQQLIHHIS